jgi:pimeloyl-ACP methyl ester carboxylesterase
MFKTYEDMLIRPPRSETTADQLGPASDRWSTRSEVRLKNARGNLLCCSLVRPANATEAEARPVFVYAHANASNRAFALEFRELLALLGASLFCFDFSGCGESEGEYVSLGLNEAEDLVAVLDYVCALPCCGPVVLCGRSMGAAAVMMYAAAHRGKHPKVAGLVFDGMFESIRSLMNDVARKESVFLGLLTPIGIPMIKRRIRARAGFSIDDVAPLECAKQVELPALFFAARSDQLFPQSHIERVCAAYAGHDKELREIDGDHNDFRGGDFWSALVKFVCRVWKVPPPDPPLFEGSVVVAQVVPFRVEGTKEMEPAYESLVPGPLEVRVEPDCLRCVSPVRARLHDDEATVWVLRYAQFVGMDAVGGSFRVMMASNAGVLIQTPFAERLMAEVDRNICSALRAELTGDMEAFLERVKRAARVLLEGGKHSPRLVKKKLEEVMLHEIGMASDAKLVAAVSDAVDKVVAEMHPKN